MKPTGDVSVLGTGAIGTAVARVLLAAGLSVVVWNRTPSHAAALLDVGARLAPSAAAAVTASPLSLLCLTDHAAAAEVLESLPASEGLGPRRTVAVLATCTPDEALTAHRLLEERGLDHLDAGVQTAPGDVGTQSALFLLAGPQPAYSRNREIFDRLGRVRYVGADPASAAVWDLALFGLWYDAQVGLLRALELTRAVGVDPRAFADAATTQLGHVVSGAAATASEVAEGDYPAGPASLAEHLPLLRQLVAARRTARTGTGGIEAIADLVAELVSHGHGSAGLSAVVGGW